jgi:D-arabinose 1-dehydrogenase-like Zn-dependent alcohol dehydrogenase
VAGQIPIQMKTELFQLDQANEVLQRLKESQINGAAVLQIGETNQK